MSSKNLLEKSWGLRTLPPVCRIGANVAWRKNIEIALPRLTERNYLDSPEYNMQISLYSEVTLATRLFGGNLRGSISSLWDLADMS